MGTIEEAQEKAKQLAAAEKIDGEKTRADLKQSEEDLARAELPLRRWTRPSTWPRRLKRVSVCWAVSPAVFKSRPRLLGQIEGAPAVYPAAGAPLLMYM